MAAAISSRNISTVYAHELSDYTDEKLIELFDGIVSSQAGYVFIPAGVDDIEKYCLRQNNAAIAEAFRAAGVVWMRFGHAWV